MIDGIVAGTWLHYKEAKRSRGPGRNIYNRQELEASLVFDRNPRCFLMQPKTIQQRCVEARKQIADSFRRFVFDLYTPALSEHFGPEVVATAGSGIDEIVAPPVRGRPRKPRLEVKEGKSGWSKILRVVFQVRDSETKCHLVCVTRELAPPCWVPLDALSPETKAWWEKERETLFPHVNFESQSPILRSAGALVTLVWDVSA